MMSLLSPDSIWRGGGGGDILCSPPHKAFSVWKEMWVSFKLTLKYEYYCSAGIFCHVINRDWFYCSLICIHFLFM